MSAAPILAGAAMLLLGLLLPSRRRRVEAARLVAAQGGMLALAAASAAWTGAGGPWLWALALGALAGRALFLPALARLATATGQGAVPLATTPPPALGRSAAAPLLAGGGLAVLAVAAVVALGAGVEAETREGLALALATLLAGLLAMVVRRRGVPSGLLGLLAAENGALLGLVHVGDGLPAATALAVLSPGLLACAALALHGRGLGAVADALPWAARR